MESAIYKARVTFTTSVLGSQPQKDIAEEFIADKFVENGGVLPDEELDALPVMMDKGTTAFHRVDGKPVFFDYQFKGFLKESGRIFNGLHNVKALRSKIENFVFVKPRYFEIHIPDGQEIGFCSRPLRAETAQGPRVAIARSEEIPAGSWFEITLEIFKSQVDDDLLRELMTYGEYKGLGQWRNGGHGRFTFEFLK